MQSHFNARKIGWLVSSVKIVLATCIAFGIANFAIATNIPEQLSFQNILQNKDIDIGVGASFFQDSEGFMWIGGSNALLRYDGYEFKQIDISHSNNSDDKTPINYAVDIFEDSHHTLWVASKVGLLTYNASKELLAKIKDDELQPFNISTTQFSKIIELPSGEILAGAKVGLFIIDPKTLKYSVIVPDEKKQHWLKSPRIDTVYMDGPANIWLGTGAGLEKLDWNTKTFSFYPLTPDISTAPFVDVVNDIVPDRDGKFWVATTTHGLVHFNPVTLQGKRYLNDAANRYSLTSNEIVRIIVDSSGTLWVAPDDGGISVYDKEQDRFINHKVEAGRAGSLSTNKPRSLYEDHNGDIWIGHYPTGVNFFDRSSAPIASYAQDISNPKSLSFNHVLSVQEDKSGNLWLGTDGGGLNFFDRKTNEFSHFTTSNSDANTINGNSVLAVFIDSGGLIWTGTWGGGIASYNPDKKKFTRYPFDYEPKTIEKVSTSSRLNSASVWSIREDKHHDLWIATYSGGISKFNRQTNLFTHYQHIEGDVNSLISNMAWSTYEDSQGNLWVGTVAGLSLMDRDKGTFTSFTTDPKNPAALSNEMVLSIYEDSKKRLWVGTAKGLNLFNPNTKQFSIFTKKSGFLNDYIKTILEDANGLLWVSTNNGFSSFDPETKKIKNYNRIGGKLAGSFAMHSGISSGRGEIIFGGTEGLRVIHPNDLAENKTAPKVALIDFKLFSESVIPANTGSVLKNTINHTDTIVLDYAQTMFEFSFSALNFRDVEKNRYTYKLTGFDKSWMDAGTQRTAKYTNLNAGTYIFNVKGSNNDGVWSAESKSITIVQLPPPWKTWWAYTLYTLTLLTLIVWFIHSQQRKRRAIEQQNRLLERRVFERTAELREKNNDIQTMLSNIHQGLFTIEVGGNIHSEYSLFLEDIFETREISGRSALALLFEHSAIGSDTLDKIKVSINSIIGEDNVNFEFNSHLLIQEYYVTINGKEKSLSLDWNSVVVNNIVVKLMVSVRDVTLLKKMEHEARSKKRELEIIGQLLNVPAKKYLAFTASTKRFIEENRAQINNNERRSDAVIARLFRNMHTIKGNCRTFNFDHFSNVVHEVESVYSALKADTNSHWQCDLLLNDLLRVEAIHQEYENVFYHVLGRGPGSGEPREQQGFWADSKAIETIQHGIDVINKKFPAANDLLPIQLLLNSAMSIPMSEVLADIINSLPSIALQLNKEAPKVVIDDKQVRIKFNSTELLTNIFSHILRNSIDHGIETAEVRLRAGKPSVGTIEIRVVPQEHNLHIYVKDDGQGINIDRLFKKGLEVGQWKADDQPGYSDIANLIFASGVSTKETVTTISGRGVGMDAVKEFLLAQGGNISLQLFGETANNAHLGQGVMVPFELIVELPESAFVITP